MSFMGVVVFYLVLFFHYYLCMVAEPGVDLRKRGCFYDSQGTKFFSGASMRTVYPKGAMRKATLFFP